MYVLNRWGGGPRVVVSTAAFHARVRGSVPGLGGLKEAKLFLPHPRVKVSIVGSLRDREVACSASDRQGSNFESCVWRTVSSQSSHHLQEVLLAQFSLYVHKGGLKPDSFHFISFLNRWCVGNRVIFSAMQNDTLKRPGVISMCRVITPVDWRGCERVAAYKWWPRVVTESGDRERDMRAVIDPGVFPYRARFISFFVSL